MEEKKWKRKEWKRKKGGIAEMGASWRAMRSEEFQLHIYFFNFKKNQKFQNHRIEGEFLYPKHSRMIYF
jgi:hypothetical protein